jgi:hypothetical protein
MEVLHRFLRWGRRREVFFLIMPVGGGLPHGGSWPVGVGLWGEKCVSEHVGGGAWFAWSLCALSLALTALSVVLLALNAAQPNTPIYDFWLENTIFPVSFSVIGAIVASCLPANPVGWFFCAAALISAIAHLSAEYAIYALLAQPGSLPAGVALAWLAYWVWIPYIGYVALSLLLFPDGRLPPLEKAAPG